SNNAPIREGQQDAIVGCMHRRCCDAALRASGFWLTGRGRFFSASRTPDGGSRIARHRGERAAETKDRPNKKELKNVAAAEIGQHVPALMCNPMGLCAHVRVPWSCAIVNVQGLEKRKPAAPGRNCGR